MQDLFLIFHRDVFIHLLQCYQSVTLSVFREYSPRKMFCIRTIVDLFLDHHRQSKRLFFMQVFLLHWKFKKI